MFSMSDIRLVGRVFSHGRRVPRDPGTCRSTTPEIRRARFAAFCPPAAAPRAPRRPRARPAGCHGRAIKTSMSLFTATDNVRTHVIPALDQISMPRDAFSIKHRGCTQRKYQKKNLQRVFLATNGFA
ncbi:hypothetical protein EVAR_42619_1 [Eumeta japonica]|uniref:Uncharacterized protein n=1 Tax=Eumeta variegata TaxID=151549 RepID=A0A4C1WX19_EUMVA|nr:hypothetical protein EVAR_42619_1 [Eumeta japonica]